MEKHINIVAALQIGLSIFNLLIAFLIFTVLKLVGGFVDDATASNVLSIVADALAVVFIVISIPGILAGMGLYKRKEWARILTLVLSVIEIFSFPFGTAIGIYSIWVLIQPETIAEFNKVPTTNI
ncbi:MAG: hypothetical protein JNK09_13280 [Prolixibacteraceae bacterium]|nr:hypothetical protein [Prolixibacteraceae bacterium]